MRLKKLYLIVFSLTIASLGQSQTPAETRVLADQFFGSGQYSSALSYYQRLAFFSKDDADPLILKQIADCFYATNDFVRALEYFDHAYFASDSESFRTQCLFDKTTILLELGNYHYALAELLGLDLEVGSSEGFKKEFYLGAAYFGLNQFEEAGRHFQSALPLGAEKQRNEIQSLFANPKKFTRPNPKTALILSAILPGAGQVYAGDLGAGINSLLLTGTFVGLVFYLSARVHPIDAILTGLPWFQRYYQGGFDHAERTAESARTNQRNRIYQQTLKIVGETFQ